VPCRPVLALARSVLPCVLGDVALIRIFLDLAAHVILPRSETRGAADLGSVEPG